MPHNPSEIEPLPEPVGAAPCRVLSVVGSRPRHAQIRTTLTSLHPDMQVETADTVVDALLRLTHRPADLLVLDLTVDDAYAPVVVRHLARVAPVTVVMVFDDRARTVPGHQVVRAWEDLDTALRRWWQDRQPPAHDLLSESID